MSVYFFFQAEDGIRDLVRSRGLGDVYKRQGELMDAIIRKWGNSPALRLPAAVMREASFAMEQKLSLIHI